MRGVTGKNADQARELRRWAEEGGYKVHVLELDVTSDASAKTVGADVQPAVVPINKKCAEVQNHLLTAFGLR